MSAFGIAEMTNNKHYSTLLKTHVWIVSSRNVLAGCEFQTVLAKLGLPHFIETAFVQACKATLLPGVQMSRFRLVWSSLNFDKNISLVLRL